MLYAQKSYIQYHVANSQRVHNFEFCIFDVTLFTQVVKIDKLSTENLEKIRKKISNWIYSFIFHSRRSRRMGPEEESASMRGRRWWRSLSAGQATPLKGESDPMQVAIAADKGSPSKGDSDSKGSVRPRRVGGGR